MKAVNIVLSILILLLSLAAAVFSYFLYEKRSFSYDESEASMDCVMQPFVL